VGPDQVVAALQRPLRAFDAMIRTESASTQELRQLRRWLRALRDEATTQCAARASVSWPVDDE
jgi:hypothetical protein